MRNAIAILTLFVVGFLCLPAQCVAESSKDRGASFGFSRRSVCRLEMIGIPGCGGLLTEAECNLLMMGTPQVPGISAPDNIIVEEKLAKLAVTLGLNYHFAAGEKWDLWAGPLFRGE